MFATRVATIQTRGNAGSTGRFGPRTSRQPKDERDGDAKREIVGESLTDLPPPRRLAWDFGKIPLFPPDRTSRSQASYPLPGIIQPKLVVGAVNDPLEHEADRVADQMMRMPAAEVAVTSAPPQISRKCEACEEEDKRVQRKERGRTGAGLSEAPASVHEVLRSPGQPLDGATRAYFEPRLGHDFRNVRVHADALAAESARAVNALAYTAGHHIVFGEGAYRPMSQVGGKLLAHELTHVVQQSERHQNAGAREVNQNKSSPSISTQVPALQTLQRQATYVDCEFTRQQDLGPREWLQCLREGRIRETYPLRFAKNGVVATETELLKWAIGERYTESLAIEKVMSSYEFVGNEKAREEARFHLLWAFAEAPEWQRAKDQWEEEEKERQAKALEDLKQEIARLQKEEAIQRFPGHIDPRKYPGIMPHGLAFLTNEYVVKVIDMLIYLIPVVGEARGIVEAVAGRNLLTGEKLGVLDRLLGALPLAPLALKGGKAVIHGVAVAVSSVTEKAALILAISQRARKGPEEILTLLSRLEGPAARIDVIRDARAAVAEGRTLTAAESDALREVDEALHGGRPSTRPAEPVKPPEGTARPGSPGLPAAEQRFGPPARISLRGQYHDLRIGRIGKRWRFLLCTACGPIIDKAEAMLKRLPKGHPAEGKLRKLIKQAQDADTWVNDVMHVVEEGQEFNHAQQELKKIKVELETIEAEHPDAVIPDIAPEPAPPPPEEAPASVETAPIASEPQFGGPAAAWDAPKIHRFAMRVGLNIGSATSQQILANLDMIVENFIGKYRAGGIRSVFPGEFLKRTVKDALLEGGSTVSKLLTDGRFVK